MIIKLRHIYFKGCVKCIGLISKLNVDGAIAAIVS